MSKLDTDVFAENVKKTLISELGSNYNKLTPDQKALLDKVTTRIASETVAVALTEGDECKKHERRLMHYKAALIHFDNMFNLQTYTVIIRIVGKLLGSTIRGMAGI